MDLTKSVDEIILDIDLEDDVEARLQHRLDRAIDERRRVESNLKSEIGDLLAENYRLERELGNEYISVAFNDKKRFVNAFLQLKDVLATHQQMLQITEAATTTLLETEVFSPNIISVIKREMRQEGGI